MIKGRQNERLTDRYVRRGGPIPCIYHGTLEGLNQALADTVSASRFLPGIVISLTAVKDGEAQVIRLYQDGKALPIPDREEAWE